MSLLHGWPGLLSAYLAVEAPMLAAMAQARAAGTARMVQANHSGATMPRAMTLCITIALCRMRATR